MWNLYIKIHVDFPGFVDYVAYLRESTAQQRQIDAATDKLTALQGRLQTANTKLDKEEKTNNAG